MFSHLNKRLAWQHSALSWISALALTQEAGVNYLLMSYRSRSIEKGWRSGTVVVTTHLCSAVRCASMVAVFEWFRFGERIGCFSTYLVSILIDEGVMIFGNGMFMSSVRTQNPLHVRVQSLWLGTTKAKSFRVVDFFSCCCARSYYS